MYIVSKTFHVQEAHLNTFLERFKKESPLLTFDGFEKREIAIRTTNGISFVRMSIYFTDKNAYYRWEASPAHIKMHQEKKEKPEGLIDVVKDKYEVYQVDESIHETST